MDHNLEDSLNLESAMGSMDFDHSGVVVNQADITLETSHEEDIPMQFEHIEEQPMLMDTGNEEIIVSDFMNDQYTLQEYSVQDDSLETSGAVETDQLSALTSQSESMIDLKFEGQTSISQDVTIQPKYISVKAAVAPARAPKKADTLVASMPRQVPIAPKPIVTPKAPKVVTTKSYPTSKHFAIAPKPVALVANKTTAVNKTLTGVIPTNMKRGAVLTQIGKQLVMMPAGAQKIKLVSSNSGTLQYVRANSDQAQLIATKGASGANAQKLIQAKVIVQGTSQSTDSNQPAVITKLLPAPSLAAPQTRYVMQQKTVPISIGGNKVILTSPTKSGIKFGKKQIIAIKSPTPKLLPTTSHGTTKKVLISTNPNQNVILKTTAPPKTAQVNKDGNVVVQGQRSQLHQINVPGKGIQYIRLITNSSPAPQKATPKAQPALTALPKNFVLTDNKGNLIQMTADKVSSGPPPLIITSNIGATSKMTTKPQRKLVRIAPVTAKPAQPTTQQPTRSAQSLLAPLSPAECKVEESTMADLMVERPLSRDSQDLAADETAEASAPEDLDPDEEIHSKSELRALLDEAVAEDTTDAMHSMHEVEVEFERQESLDVEEGSSMEHEASRKSDEHPLIVIPTNFIKQENQIRVTSEHSRHKDDSHNYTNIENEVMPPYLSPKPSHALSESDLVAGELGMRPRKACNCTKSQCLKLYCDCFANGEFCNRCNCNNCHNNLENEELRQKAIRACLDRNPNAFRPKIGKSKSGGPDIIRRHNKGCNCKRSGCLKNYCECFEAKIACTAMCKCVGCRNVEDTLERRRAVRRAGAARPPPPALQLRQPCSFMTSEVIEAVCQCLVAAAVEGGEGKERGEAEGARESADPVRDVIEEFARCLQDIISASHQSTAMSVLDEVTAP